MSLPTLVSEDQIRRFNYCWHGQVRTGMFFKDRLFTCLGGFEEDERAVAYEHACRLAQNHDVVMTAAQQVPRQYYLWAEISAHMDTALLQTQESLAALSQKRRGAAGVIPLQNQGTAIGSSAA